MTPKDFYNQTNGRIWDIDGAYGGQCWDLFAKFCSDLGIPLSVIHCSTTGYVRDIWNNRNTNGILLYFDEVHAPYQNGDWVIWDSDYSLTPKSHVGMYLDGACYNQAQGKPAYLLDALDFSQAKGGFRWKGWSVTHIEEKYSEILYEDIPMSLYRAPAGYRLYMLSAGIGQLEDIKLFDNEQLEILAAVNAGYFQMAANQPDPYGTHYGVEQTYNGVDLAPKKSGLLVFYESLNDGVEWCRSDKYWLSREEVHFAVTPYSVLRHNGEVVTGTISGDLGSKEFVTNMQTMIAKIGKDWILCVTKKPCLPTVMARFADSIGADEAVLMDSGGSTQMMAWTGNKYTPVVYTGRKIPNVMVIAKEKSAHSEPIQGDEPGDEEDTIIIIDPPQGEENGGAEMPKTLLSDRVYDVLKWFALICLPACSVFVLTIGPDLFPNYELIAKVISAVAVLLGSLIGVSTAQYNAAKSGVRQDE